MPLYIMTIFDYLSPFNKLNLLVDEHKYGHLPRGGDRPMRSEAPYFLALDT